MNIDILINKEHSLDKDFVPENLFQTDKNENNFHNYRNPELKPMVASEIMPHFILLRDAAKKDGLNFVIDSGYRSFDYQQNIWDSYVAQKGIKKAEETVAKPGTSEHQTGLAIDIAYYTNGKYVDDVKENDKEAVWLSKNAYKFGFILRYPKGKTNITGYKFEPWHYRFVGIPIANILKYYDLTLEEYYLKKEYYDNLCQVVKDPKFITRIQLVAALLVIKKETNKDDVLNTLAQLQESSELEFYDSSLDFIIDYIYIKNNRIFLKEGVTSEEIEQLSILAGSNLITLIKSLDEPNFYIK